MVQEHIVIGDVLDLVQRLAYAEGVSADSRPHNLFLLNDVLHSHKTGLQRNSYHVN